MKIGRRTIVTALGLGALAAGTVALAPAATNSGQKGEHAAPTPPTLPPIYSTYGQYGVPGKRVLFARLEGRNEIGVDGKSGAGNAFGLGGASVVIKGRLICASIVMIEGGFPVAAHIHRGVSGQNGPVAIPLPTPVAGTAISANSSGCIEANPLVIEEIRTKPASFYVNVHTNDFPNGALRGKLEALPTKAPAKKKKPVKKKVRKKKAKKKAKK